MPVINDNRPPVQKILCPHITLDETGNIDYKSLDRWGRRQMDMRTIDLDVDHTIYLCPICADVVRGVFLTEVVQTAIQSGAKTVVSSIIGRK